MEIFAAQLSNAVVLGGIYGLLVTGFNLILVVGGVFHAAYPHTVVMSMYICWLVLKATGNTPLAILAGIGAAIGMSLISEVIFRPLVKRRAMIMSFVLALGMSMIFVDVMARQLNMGLPISFPTSFTGKGTLLRYGLISITTGQLITLIGCVVAVIVFLWLVYRTKQGRAFRVIAQQPVIARILGVPITRSGILTWGIAGLMAGISALFLAMGLTWASSALAGVLWIKVLAISLFAGLGNLRGGLYGALILAFAETMVLAYLPGDWSNAIAFAMIIIVVAFKPRGLFGVAIA